MKQQKQLTQQQKTLRKKQPRERNPKLAALTDQELDILEILAKKAQIEARS